jgi:hypothetical protein
MHMLVLRLTMDDIVDNAAIGHDDADELSSVIKLLLGLDSLCVEM